MSAHTPCEHGMYQCPKCTGLDRTKELRPVKRACSSNDSPRQSTHTPGPWTTQPIGDETECNVLGAGRELVATVSDNDARLIAAAPRMLAFIRKTETNMVEEARAILRDVEGESNA